MAKLRLVRFVDSEGKPTSYFHLEKSEEQRARDILKALPNFQEWTPISRLAKEIGSSTLITTWTALKLWAAKYADIEMYGKNVIIAQEPLILIRKEKHNTRKNATKQKYLRPPIYIKHPHS